LESSMFVLAMGFLRRHTVPCSGHSDKAQAV
jgi:hypothetical protein